MEIGLLFICEELNLRARLISGYPKPSLMMEGLDGSFDGVMFVGYHAKASTISCFSV